MSDWWNTNGTCLFLILMFVIIICVAFLSRPKTRKIQMMPPPQPTKEEKDKAMGEFYKWLHRPGGIDGPIQTITTASAPITLLDDVGRKPEPIVCAHCGVSTDKTTGICEHCGAPLP